LNFGGSAKFPNRRIILRKPAKNSPTFAKTGEKTGYIRRTKFKKIKKKN